MNKLTFLFSLILGSLTAAAANQNVVVVLDDSGSMTRPMNNGTSKASAARNAMLQVLQQLDSEDKLGIITLNRGWLIPLSPLNKQTMNSAIRRFKCTGNTPLAKAMKHGSDALLQLRSKQHYGTYRLLVVTDGQAQFPRSVDKFNADIMSRGITVDVIGVAMKSSHSLATRAHSYRSADDPAALKRAVVQVLAESKSDSNASGESDFEFLQGFPIELAASSLQALSQVDNDPIGKNKASLRDTAAPAQHNRSTSKPQRPMSKKDFEDLTKQHLPREAESKSGGMSWIFIIFGIVFILSIIGKVSGGKK